MKSLILKTALTAITLSITVSSSFAAPSNGPKPSCYNMGEIAVFSNGMWVCKQPSIKAKGNGMESAVGGGGNKLANKKPKRARPDYIITKVKRKKNNDKVLAVTVKNLGSKASVAGSELFATVKGGDVGIAGIAMPMLKDRKSVV